MLAREDDLIVGEFLAELTPLERSVFALVADGRSWRAIATALAGPLALLALLTVALAYPIAQPSIIA